MSQTVLNDHQACWLIQLTSYDFTIQYCQDSLNPADESSWRLNYIAELGKEHWSNDDSMSEQISNLMSMLVRKLATVALIRTGRQYSCQVKSADSETEDLIQVLSLQTITWSKIRLTTDDLKLYRETIDLNEKTVSSSILASLETEFSDFFISFGTGSSDLFISIVKNKSSILSLIKEVQEFDLLCRWISS